MSPAIVIPFPAFCPKNDVELRRYAKCMYVSNGQVKGLKMTYIQWVEKDIHTKDDSYRMRGILINAN